METCECGELVSAYDDGSVLILRETGPRLVCGWCFDENHAGPELDCE